MLRSNLEDYNFPEDLREMEENELPILAAQIRDFLVRKVSKTGGHLASNLGVVELTIALYRAFHMPEDKLIWDVGHQSYVHKILSGRAGAFDTLRQTGGLSGFPKAKESDFDAFETGHSSTSLAAAAGYAKARDILHEKYDVAAVIGDGAMTGGMAYEALNNIGASKSRVIIILNDNAMSISRNIGGMPRHLNKLRTSKKYLSSKDSVKELLNRIPLAGPDIQSALSDAKNWVKYALMRGGILFEELGFTYLGPVNGHDLNDLESNLEEAKRVRGPVLIHVITRKGKGYYNAEKDPDKFHGIAPFDPETGRLLKTAGLGWSMILGQALVEEAKQDPAITAITAAMAEGTGLRPFADRFPKRFSDVGIAEQYAVTFAAGQAKGGLKPLVAVYSTFLQRAYDQIIEDVCLQDLPVVFGVDRAGIVGNDGETHHGIFDLTYLLPVPNMTVWTPGDRDQLKKMVHLAFRLEHPVAIRYPRGSAPENPLSQDGYVNWEEPEDIKNIRLREAGTVDIWAEGNIAWTALEAAEILEREYGIRAGVVDVCAVKPMDLGPLDPSCRSLVTLEDGMISGGFGQALTAELPDEIRTLNLGWPDTFIQQGSPADLYRIYGLDAAGTARRIAGWAGRRGDREND